MDTNGPSAMDIRPLQAGIASSLYVGDLSPEMSEAELQNLFGKHGAIENVRIVRNITGSKKVCYGYVNFQNPDDANRALEKLNYSVVHNKSIRIMWSVRDPSMRKSGVGNIFIKNLDKNVDQRTLYKTFSSFGTVLSVKVVSDEKGESKGYAFVHFKDVVAANQAIKKLHGTRLSEKSKPIEVSEFIPRLKRDDRLFNNLYLKNFPPSWEEKEVDEHFSKFGEIISTKICVCASMNLKKFAFVCFKNTKDAEMARKEMHDMEFSHEDASGTSETLKLYVVPALKKSDRIRQLNAAKESRMYDLKSTAKAVNLYIKHLPDDVDDATFKSKFEEFGIITSAKIMRDEHGLSKGFGFVCYAEEISATNALAKMKHNNVFGKPLYVSHAQKKEDRRNQFLNRRPAAYYNNFGTYNNYMHHNTNYMPIPPMNMQYNKYGLYMNGAPKYGPEMYNPNVQQYYGQNMKPNFRQNHMPYKSYNKPTQLPNIHPIENSKIYKKHARFEDIIRATILKSKYVINCSPELLGKMMNHADKTGSEIKSMIERGKYDPMDLVDNLFNAQKHAS